MEVWKLFLYRGTMLGWVIIIMIGMGGMTTSALAESLVTRDVKIVIEELIKEKEMAVNQQDRKRFLQLLNPSLSGYIQEQKRWFDDAIHYMDPNSFRLEIVKLVPGKEHQIYTWIKQSYRKQGQLFTVTYPLLFQETEAGWKDSDLPFYHLAQDQVVVHYTDKRLQVQAAVALDAVTKTVRSLGRKFDWDPQEQIEVKLYGDPEVFRQSVKLSLPDWAAGWYEAGQAIKFVGAPGFSERVLASGMVHEVTHQMVSQLSGDNAAYWLQEGAAEYYQAHLLPGLKGEVNRKPLSTMWTFRQLEATHLESLPREQTEHYYIHCYDLYRYLVKKYGEEKIAEIFSLLAMTPAIDRDHGDKLTEMNQRTRTAMEKVLGISVDQLGEDWQQWREGEARLGK